MPLPWAPGGRHVLAPRIEDRALSVKQLQQLRLFLRRLCKTRLLRFTEASAFSPERRGEPLDWFEINLYHITDEVIRRAIPEVLSDGKPFVDVGGNQVAAPASGKWCSWSELVMEEGRKQTAAIMFSHWWGGSFRDFMSAVDMLVQDKALSMHTMIWICTFANNQFGEDFGAQLADCPFIRVLNVVSTTILIVDRYQGSLERTWCGLELHYSLKREHNLELYTSSGRVGSARVSSGNLVEAVKAWDIRATEASEEAYRRQILNYIAEVEETSGLLTKDGQLVVDRGRPQLDPPAARQALDAELPRAAGREQCEFAYESSLFRRRRRAFEDLNMMVRLEVMAKIGREKRKEGCKVEDWSHRGVTLVQWRSFVKRVRDAHGAERWDCLDCSAQEKRKHRWEELVIYHVYDHFLRPVLNTSGGCSYMELMSDGPQIPKFFVSHKWSNTFHGLAATLDCFVEAMQLPDSASLWIDLMGVSFAHDNYHEAWAMMSQSIWDQCDSLLAYLSESKTEQDDNRTWCFYEYEMFGRSGKDMFLGCATGIVACSRPLPGGEWVFGRFSADLARQISAWELEENLDSDSAEVATIKARMFGSDERGFRERFHAQLQRWSAGPMLRDAAGRGQPEDLEEIRNICRTRGLWINSASFCGPMGETALHVASAAGHLSAMRVLLEMRADPDVEDDIRERPLHYAALAGQTEAARLLLQAGADLHAESSYRETACGVAEQAPAAFLGTVSASGVAQLLRDAEADAANVAAAGSSSTARPVLTGAARALAGALGLGGQVATAGNLVQLFRHLASRLGTTGFTERDIETLLQAAASRHSDRMTVDEFLLWVCSTTSRQPANASGIDGLIP